MLNVHEPFPDAWRPLLGTQLLMTSAPLLSEAKPHKQLCDLPRKLQR